MYKVHMLPASFGDSLLIEYGKPAAPKYILIDGGPYFAFDEWLAGIRRVAPDIREIELLVVTHIDIDHIDGILVLLNRSQLPFHIKEVWFNGWDQIKEYAPKDDLLGPKQGEYLSVLIEDRGISHNASFGGGPVVLDHDNIPKTLQLPGGMEITLLSPSRQGLADMAPVWKEVVEEVGDAEKFRERLGEDSRYEYEPDSDLLGELNIEALQNARETGDTSEANASSIAFLASYEEKTVLFAGDAHSDQLEATLKKLGAEKDSHRFHVDAWKLSHHGSKKSTLSYLMELIDCKQMLISSDGKRYKHPNEETLARLIKFNGPDIQFNFNYRTQYNEPWDDSDLQDEFKFKTTYPTPDKTGLTIKL